MHHLLRCRLVQTWEICRGLEIEPESDVDAGAVVVGMNRCDPGRRSNDDATAHGCVDRGIGAVVGAISLFDRLVVALPLALVVSLLLLVGVVMVVAMGLNGGA